MVKGLTVTAAAAAVLGGAVAILVTPDIPPKGFNTFDSYPGLNETEVLQLADAMAEQLLPSGYEYLVLDGGWSATSKILPNGTKVSGPHLDEYGRPLPDPNRFPSGFPWLVQQLKAKGLKLGLWTIRGVKINAVEAKSKVYGTNYTVDQLVDIKPVGGGPNGSCLWEKATLGINASHPAAQAFYDSKVALMSSWGVDFIKADCFMCAPCYTAEIELFTNAVKSDPREIVLSYSPGGDNAPQNGLWVAENQLGSMYRITTDFHGGWYGWGGLQQNIFTAGNFSALGLFGQEGGNGTHPDLDMLPLSANWWSGPQEQADRGETIATVWMITRSGLMHAGKLPADPKTLAYETNAVALEAHAYGDPHIPVYQGNCRCASHATDPWTRPVPHAQAGKLGPGCTLDRTAFPACVAKWVSPINPPQKPEWTAVAFINIGENTTEAEMNLNELHMDPSVQWELEDVWTGKSEGMITGSDTKSFSLRPHASVFIKAVPHTLQAVDLPKLHPLPLE